MLSGEVRDESRRRTQQRHGFPTDGMAMDFPYARSVVVVRSRRTEKRTQKTTEDCRY